MTITKLNKKGQIIIPKKVRDKLGLEENDKFQITVIDEKTITLKLITTKIDNVAGMLSHYATRAFTIEEMDEGIARYLQNKYQKD